MTRTEFARAIGAAPLALTLVAGGCRAPADAGGITAITHVTLIPATGQPPLHDATVLIDGRMIRAAGPAHSVTVPRGARVIDGNGKYLIPGLIDMHVHVSKTRASALGVFLANGVTTVRDVGGDHQELLVWRGEVRRGTRVGPRMLIAGPYLESQSNIERMRADPPEERVEPFERARIGIGTPERAREVIDSLARLELDFFKIRTVQDAATYRAIVAAARTHGKSVVGHTNANSPEDVIAAGQRGVEHGWIVAMDSVPAERRMEIWRSLARAGVAVTPTLVVFSDAVFLSDSAAAVALNDSLGAVDPRRKFVSRFLALDWREQYGERAPQVSDAWLSLHRSLLRNYREMREAGVSLMTGSDVAVFGIYPGSSLHKEMFNFVNELGIPPLEAIERATRIPAEFLGIADSVGTIQAGRVADLVLLDADPIADIRNVTRIVAVSAGGRVFERTAIDSILAEVLRAADLRENDWKR